ncbi:Dabb family protein [Flagellimonas olearia]|nr:Dabb family protein [Allomuricauda olearia]
MKTIATILWFSLSLLGVHQGHSQQQTVIHPDGPFTKMLLFKWNEQVTPEQKDHMTDLFEDLVKEVQGFDSFEIMELTHSHRFETAFVLKFSSGAAEKTYREHPKHQQLGQLGPLLVKDFQEVKY